jgi:imidazolonepropionase-like amidohydrolase
MPKPTYLANVSVFDGRTLKKRQGVIFGIDGIAIRAGVHPVCGTDAGTPCNPHGSAPQEIVFMVEWGMSPLDARRAATANGAELLRLPDVGTIETGKRADLLLVDGDPVEDPPTLLGRRSVWQAGIPV